MAATITTAFWSMTINNPDETSLALVRNGYPDYCREIVHTLEEGKEGTPHIQAWIKLQRQQRMSFLKKLFPRGHFKALTSAEYVQNTKLYAQKDDETTRSAHVHVFHDPTGTIESLIPQVIERMWNHEAWENDHYEADDVRRFVEQEMVTENYRLAKVFVSAVYKQMWKQFGTSLLTAISIKKERDTHTHTHSDEKFSRQGGIANAGASVEEEVDQVLGQEEGEDDEDHDDGSGSETEASDESDDSGCSESDAESED